MDTSVNSIPTEQPTMDVPPSPGDTDTSSKIPKKFSLFRELLVVVILSITTLPLSIISHRLFFAFLFTSIGSLNLPFPFNLLVVLFLLPYGFDVILWIPFLVVLCILLRKLLKLDSSKRRLLVALVITCLAVIASRTVLFRLSVSQGEEYLKNRVSVITKQRDEIVGTTKAEFTYKDAQPTYSQSGSLESITVTFLVKLPKTGDYQIDMHVRNPGFNLYDSVKPDITIPNQLLELTYDTQNSEKEIGVLFDAKDLHTDSYEEQLKVSIDAVLRVNIAIDAPIGGGTQNFVRVESIDTGKSTNVSINNDYGYDQLNYSIGTFPLQSP